MPEYNNITGGNINIGGKITAGNLVIGSSQTIGGKSSGAKIVCLCGSTRFHDAYVEANRRETMKGNIVLSCGVFGNSIHSHIELTESDKEALDALHREKIRLAHEILVIDVDGYIGDSTRQEIAYAIKFGKTVRYYSQEND